MTTAAILLAAGESARMGSPKALLPWGGVTLIEYQVRELAAAGIEDIVVVLGDAAEEVRGRVPPAGRVVVNEAYREGRASSLRAGAAALPDSAGPVLVLNVDQPRPREVHLALLSAHQAGDALITLPVAEGRRGHPTVLAGALLPELRNVSEETQGLRRVVSAHRDETNEVEVSSGVVLVDINTPAGYREALARHGQTRPCSSTETP
jgi:molybdenum cofactor cytidylyltransferase